MRKLALIFMLLTSSLMSGCDVIDDPPSTDREGALPDVNSTSSTAGQYILPEDYKDFVSAWYFGKSTWGYCRTQFGRLDDLQKKLDAEHPNAGIFIIGVNAAGEAGSEEMTEGRDLPLLQDTQEDDWWGEWAVTWRDVIILDRDGSQAGVFNLTEHDLMDPDEYAALEAMLLDIADAE